MKVVRTARLWFKEGTSDKVYEVDLVENDALASGERFLVNFRYGRRGSALREGSKTPSPVAADAAERAFESVVVSKVNDGYRRIDRAEGGQPRPASGDDAAPAGQGSLDGRARELLARLDACLRSPWPPKDRDRLLWRIGQVRISAATHLLVELAARLGPSEASYSLVWALARCGGAASVPMLREIAVKTKSEITRELARFALVSPLAGEAREVVSEERELPEAVGRAARDGNVDALAGALIELAEREPMWVGQTLVSLGRRAQGDAALHAVLADTLLRLPARPPFLIGLRRLFKHAEMADDAALFAATAHRFESARPMYRREGWRGNTYVAELRTSVQIKDLKGRPDARVGLSLATLLYLKRRIWRSLRKRGELGDPAFAELAAAYLLTFRPEDLDKRTSWTAFKPAGPGQPWTRETHARGPLGRNWTASQLLYRHAPAVKTNYGALTLTEIGGTPAGPGGEAFPKLWDARPDLGLKLVAQSPCEPVVQLGLRILSDAPEFLSALSAADLARLLAAPLVAAQRLGFEIARDRLAGGAADPGLLIALLHADFREARRLAEQRIDADPALPWNDAGLGLAVLTASAPDLQDSTLRWARDRRVEPAAGAALAQALADFLLETPDQPDEARIDVIRLARARISELWSASDMPLGGDIVARLVGHPAPAVQAAGVDLLRLSGVDPSQLSDEQWRALLGSDQVEVQTAALNLFGGLDDEALARHAPLVVAFATAPSSALRQAARPLVARLAARDQALADRLSRELIDSLFRAAPDDDYAVDAVALIKEAFPDRIDALEPAMVWRLLQARAKGAQLLGAEALRTRPPAAFSVRQIARLGGHAQLSVRDWATAAFEAEPERFIAGAHDAVLLVESDWPEVQDFARSYFDRWPAEAWTPETLAVVTDSVKPEVQAFARRLIRSRLAPGDVAAQLTRLLEHPSASMHLLVTELLTEEAAASEAAFDRLLPLARIVMLQVQKGRIAKDRMAAFLKAEAVRDRGRAERIAPLLADLSLSGTERDRAAAVLALRDIGDAHPGLDMPLKRRAPAGRAA